MQAIARSPSVVGGYHCLDYNDHKSGLKGASGLSLKEREQDSTPFLVDRMSTRPVSRTPPTKRRAASLSTNSDDSLPTPLTPPPLINNLSYYMQSDMAPPKPYRRNGPTTLERQYVDSQLFSRAAPSQVDEQGVCFSIYIYIHIQAAYGKYHKGRDYAKTAAGKSVLPGTCASRPHERS